MVEFFFVVVVFCFSKLPYQAQFANSFVKFRINTVSIFFVYSVIFRIAIQKKHKHTQKQFDVHAIRYKVKILVHGTFIVCAAQISFFNLMRESSMHEWSRFNR